MKKNLGRKERRRETRIKTLWYNLGRLWRWAVATILSVFPALLVGLLIKDSDLMYDLPIGFGGQILIAEIVVAIVFFGLLFLLYWDWISRT